MNHRKTKHRGFLLLTLIVTITLVCWDLTSSLKYAEEEGTYRYESEFDAVTSATTKVAIVPSNYTELSDPVSRSVDPSYEQIEDMVRKAIELQGGLDWVIHTGDKVMIKVNLVGGNSPSGQGENTDVRVVKALIKIIDELTGGDVEIVVGEGTARTNDVVDEPGSVWDHSGYQDLLTDHYLEGINFRLFNLNQTYEQTLEITLGNKATAAPHHGYYHVHEEEIDADVFISVPVLKIHDTGITCALKNQIGTAPGCYYGYNKMQGSEYYGGLVHDVGHRRWTTEEIVDLCAIADVDFVVVDAIMCLEKYKTYDGTNQIRFNTIVATADPVAADHVCARLFCLNPDDIAHITLAEKIGLGTNDPDKITLVGAPIDEVKKRVIKNSTQNGRFGQSNRTWLLSQYFNSTDIEEELIPDEAAIKPIAGANGWSEPVYFFDDRIDLLSFYTGLENIISYAFTYFSSPADQQAELWLGTHEDMKVFINNQEVYSFKGINVYGDDDLYTAIVDIDIQEGENTLLVKTLNKYNDYSFALNICEVEDNINYSGNRVPGLKFYTTSKDTSTVELVKQLEGVFQNTVRCYPNPVEDYAIIEFETFERAYATVDIYTLSGIHIANLANKVTDPGIHRYVWKVHNQISKIYPGVYICTVHVDDDEYSTRLIVQ
jgi:uncharacterized protein (DUF362 family)